MSVALTATVLLAVVPGRVDAHTALLEASPGPDDTAGGLIEGIDLAFLDPISNAIVTVLYNGQPVAGGTTVSDGELIRFEFDEPLSQAGRYQVRYEMTSFDLDYTTSGFFFTYANDAPQPARLSSPNDDAGFPIIPSAIALAILVALLAVFVFRLDSRRRQATVGGYDGADYDDRVDEW